MDDADFLESVADRLVQLGEPPNGHQVARLRAMAGLTRWALGAAKRRRGKRRDTSWPRGPSGHEAGAGTERSPTGDD